MSQSDTSLRLYEKHMALVLGAIVVSLGVYSPYWNGQSVPSGESIVIHVVGAVEESYEKVRKGATVDEVLGMVRCLSDAEVENMLGSKRLYENGEVVVPFKNKITLFIYGAVKAPKVLIFDKIPKASEILEKIETSPDADTANFRRRKIFRNGMKVEVRKKRTRK